MVDALSSATLSGGRALLSRTVFMSLYTLALKANAVNSVASDKLVSVHNRLVQEFVVGSRASCRRLRPRRRAL